MSKSSIKWSYETCSLWSDDLILALMLDKSPRAYKKEILSKQIVQRKMCQMIQLE